MTMYNREKFPLDITATPGIGNLHSLLQLHNYEFKYTSNKHLITQNTSINFLKTGDRYRDVIYKDNQNALKNIQSVPIEI